MRRVPPGTDLPAPELLVVAFKDGIGGLCTERAGCEHARVSRQSQIYSTENGLVIDGIAIDPSELGLIPVPNQNLVVKPYCMSHGTLLCRDLKKTRKFYEEFLGLEVVRHSVPSMVFRCGHKFHVACVQMGDKITPSGRHNH